MGLCVAAQQCVYEWAKHGAAKCSELALLCVRASRSAPHNRGLRACGVWQRKGRHHQLLLTGNCQGFPHRELLCDGTHCSCTQTQATCMHLQVQRKFATSNALVLASALAC